MAEQEFFGYGSIENLSKVLKQKNYSNILVFTGKGSFESSGAKSLLEKQLNGHNYLYVSDFNINPDYEDIKKIIPVFRKFKPDIVISVGGGSVMDMAKLVNYFGTLNISPEDYFKNPKTSGSPLLPMIAIPTTAGSGSEATSFAVVYKDKIKYSLDSKHLMPKVVIIDPQFTLKLNSRITAETSLDALSHSIESLWSVHATNESIAYSLQALELIWKNIVSVVKNPDRINREAMAQGAFLAGKAINITKTTAAHAISYTLTANYHIAHGLAVMLTLGEIFIYNFEVDVNNCNDLHGTEYVKSKIKKAFNIFGSNDYRSIAKLLKELPAKLELSTKVKIKNNNRKEVIDEIVSQIDPNRLGNNPRKLSTQDLYAIVEKIF